MRLWLLRGFAVNKTVMRIDPARLVAGGVPEALAETLLQVPRAELAQKPGRWFAAGARACRRLRMTRSCSAVEALEEFPV